MPVAGDHAVCDFLQGGVRCFRARAQFCRHHGRDGLAFDACLNRRWMLCTDSDDDRRELRLDVLAEGEPTLCRNLGQLRAVTGSLLRRFVWASAGTANTVSASASTTLAPRAVCVRLGGVPWPGSVCIVPVRLATTAHCAWRP